MNLADIVATHEAVGATRSRLAKTAALAELLARISVGERVVVVPWLSGALRQGRIGVGPALLGRVWNTPPAAVPTLTAAEVDEAFTAVGEATGKGASARREQILRELLARATPPEQRFLVPLLVGELRQGALVGVMAEAVATAAGVDGNAVRRALMLSGDVAATALAALDGGATALAAFQVEIFRPLHPMLADTAEDVGEAVAALGEARYDLKLDGARVQVHKDGDRVRVFTRHLRDVTGAVPEVVEAARRLSVQQAILDGEAIALLPDGRPHPFQVTMQRFGRQKDVAEARAGLPLSVFLFDLLYADGELIDAPLRERTARLVSIAPEALIVPHQHTADPAVVLRFLQQAIDQGHEGLMGKDPASTYAAGQRGGAWLKLKPALTLDLVVLAAEWGSGRRQGLLSNLWLGARDGDGWAMLGKTFKGLTDELLAWQTTQLLARETRREGHVVHVRPELVVEIAFNEVQTSPTYESGLALRFARVKGYRPEKRAAEADTIETIRAIHARAIRPEAI